MILYNPETHHVKEMDILKIAELLDTSESVIRSRLSRNQNYIKAFNLYIFRKLEKAIIEDIYKNAIYPDEIWVKSAHSEKYECSTRGRVRRVYKSKKVILMPYYKHGTLDQFIKIDMKEIKVSRVILSAFEGRVLLPSESAEHMDGQKNNNRSENLRVATKKELGKKTGAMSRSQPILKIDIESGKILDEYRSIREAARQNFMSHETINSAFKRDTDIAGGFRWKFGEWDIESLEAVI